MLLKWHINKCVSWEQCHTIISYFLWDGRSLAPQDQSVYFKIYAKFQELSFTKNIINSMLYQNARDCGIHSHELANDDIVLDQTCDLATLYLLLCTTLDCL
mgnify:CR=1 FL=1